MKQDLKKELAEYGPDEFSKVRDGYYDLAQGVDKLLMSLGNMRCQAGSELYEELAKVRAISEILNIIKLGQVV